MSRTLYRLSYGHAIGRGSRIRTCDIRLPKPTRYLAALCPEFGTPSGDRTRVSDLKGRRTFRCSMGAKIKNLVESHGIEPRVAWGVRFTAGWVCRIPHFPMSTDQNLERTTGVEPVWSAWKAETQPICQVRENNKPKTNWSRNTDSNRGHPLYRSGALPTELFRQMPFYSHTKGECRNPLRNPHCGGVIRLHSVRNTGIPKVNEFGSGCRNRTCPFRVMNPA